MELVNEFTVSVPIEEAWAVLTDLERIAPCMPGASLEEVSGDDYVGTVKIKVGPITSSYKGKVRFTQKDDAAHKAVLRAEGRDTKGQGNASADITATLTEVQSETHCKVEMSLTISGRVAQFGRGVLADVSQKLVEQFVNSLEKEVLGAKDSPSSSSEETDTASEEPKAEAEAISGSKSNTTGSVNALGLIAKPVAKRALPVFAVLVVVGILLRRRARHS